MVGLMLSVATIGCVKTDDPNAVQTGVLRLQLSNGEHATRAEGDAENTDPLNEFKLATAQVFFLDASGNVLQSHYESSLNAVQEKTVTIPLSAEQLTDLFDNGKGHVYVIANYGSEIDDTDDTTNSLADLKKLAIGFEETSGSVATQSSFVMDSEPIEVTYDGQNKTISGEVPLTRAAAKIELTVNVAPLTQDGKTLYLKFKGKVKAEAKIWPDHNYREYETVDKNLRRVGFVLQLKANQSVDIEVTMSA